VAVWPRWAWVPGIASRSSPTTALNGRQSPTPRTGWERCSSRCTNPSSTRTGLSSCVTRASSCCSWPTDPDLFQRVAKFPLSIPCLEHLVLLGGKDNGRRTYHSLMAAGLGRPHQAVHPAPTATACLMYTSGTTGDPKGVVLSHGNILSNVRALLQVIPLSTEYRTLSFLPWAHAFGHTVELHLLIAAGASMGIAESVEALVANFPEVRRTPTGRRCARRRDHRARPERHGRLPQPRRRQPNHLRRRTRAANR
jgi:acyl-CoA synthetase (AMP-forming)/AMP-acid ligase II